MRKFLSIIIPRYKETEKEIFPLLSSINGQVGMDFSDIEVIIATDGKENPELDQGFLNSPPGRFVWKKTAAPARQGRQGSTMQRGNTSCSAMQTTRYIMSAS